mmetsp:Transcript_8158/g.50576  ORF Transcript_8158/g.50576 Transcript_8158/m.50576 type:complete len:290 (-) Transcript_8158:3285-4154(-)
MPRSRSSILRHSFSVTFLHAFQRRPLDPRIRHRHVSVASSPLLFFFDPFHSHRHVRRVFREVRRSAAHGASHAFQVDLRRVRHLRRARERQLGTSSEASLNPALNFVGRARRGGTKVSARRHVATAWRRRWRSGGRVRVRWTGRDASRPRAEAFRRASRCWWSCRHIRSSSIGWPSPGTNSRLRLRFEPPWRRSESTWCTKRVASGCPRWRWSARHPWAWPTCKWWIKNNPSSSFPYCELDSCCWNRRETSFLRPRRTTSDTCETRPPCCPPCISTSCRTKSIRKRECW